METKVSVHKIIRYISSQGADHADEILEWLNESSENVKIFQDLKDLWQITGSFPEHFYPDRKNGWEKVRRHVRSKKRKYILFRRAAQIAAAVVIIFLSIWTGSKLGHKSHSQFFTEVKAPAGQKTSIILPDSSIVLLNGGSSVRYSNNFNEEERYIELQGEGYFNVTKNLSRRFVVHTSEIDVRVFGTSFNVKAYEEDQIVEVGLKTGSVGINRNDKEILKLSPGQLACFDREEKKMDVQSLNIDIVSAWTKDELIFEEASMEEILKYLERWYGVEFDVSPEVIDSDRLTFRVKTESLKETLTYLGLLKPIKYKINGKHVIITKS